MKRSALILLLFGALTMAAVRPRVSVITNSAKLIPLSVLIQDYLREYEFSPVGTQRAKAGDLREMNNFLASALDRKPIAITLDDVTESALRSFKQNRLAAEEAPATVERRIYTIKHFFASVSKAHNVENPASALKPPRRPGLRFKGYTPEQYAALMEVADRLSPRDRFVVKLLTETGLRREEACCLVLGQISDDWTQFNDVLGKGDKFRNIPITQKLFSELMLYLEWRAKSSTRPTDRLLISNHDSRSMHDSTLARIFQAACLRTNIIPESFATAHKARHTFAHRALAHLSKQLGAADALRTLAQVLGHSRLETMMVYTEKPSDQVSSLMERMA